jgi:multiple sugar transport system substrate-binding protein
MLRSLFSANVIATCIALALTVSCKDSRDGQGKGDGEARGPITLAGGKDVTGKLHLLLDKWNQNHPNEKVALLELPESADEQRNSIVQNFQAKSSRYDVIKTDVVWTAEFAARGWVEPLEEGRFATDRILRTAADTAKYEGKLYAAPYTTNAGMLYYRSDLVRTPPATWAELVRLCNTVAKQNSLPCYAGQFAQYEGLTVNVSEAVNSAGGSFVEDGGKKVIVDSPQAREGLQFLVDGFAQGWIPKEAITYKEEESRRAFQQGRLLFLRNWSYVYNLANTDGPDSRIAGKFKAALLPGPKEAGSSTLGGFNLALSRFSAHKATAKDWMEFMQSEATQRFLLTDLSQSPVAASVYDDPQLQARIPYLATLKESILRARKRPQTANYNATTIAIQRHAYPALQGRKSVGQAITDMAEELKQAASRR